MSQVVIEYAYEHRYAQDEALERINAVLTDAEVEPGGSLVRGALTAAAADFAYVATLPDRSWSRQAFDLLVRAGADHDEALALAAASQNARRKRRNRGTPGPVPNCRDS